MKSSLHIYTRTRFGIDIRVWFTILILVVMSLGLLAYKLADETACKPIKIITKGYRAGMENSFYLGEKISFTAQTDNEQVLWDFGDHTEEKSGNNVEHIFLREGKYIVSAGVNEKCTESITISISRIPQPTFNIDVETQNPINGPDLTRVGEPINLVCNRIASAYEWTVLNNPNFPLQHSNIASYSFAAPGSVTVVLKLDNDPKKEYRKTVQVLPPLKAEGAMPANNANRFEQSAPTHYPTSLPSQERKKEQEEESTNEEHAKPKAIIIPSQEFASMLKQVTEGKKDLESFNTFLCSGAQTKVLANGSDWETVGSFYAKIRGKKKYDIQSVEAVRDEQNCVTLLKVTYKKKTLGIF